jgi:hypothetical protein
MGDGFDENPFADPSIQKASGSVNNNQQQSLDDYNPFANQNIQAKPAAIIPTNTRQPEYTPIETAPPSYTNSSSQKLDLNQIERQQEELDRRAAELDRREQNINTPTGGEKNFPPTPMWFPKPLRPCFYQDINREIPIEFQKWVRALFYLWSFHAFVLAFNIIAALVVWVSTDKGGTTFGFAILYFILFTPLSYVCWFRPAYKGFRSDDSVNFMIFFFIFFLQCIFSVISSFSGEWFCGIILLVSLFSGVTAQTAFAAVMVLITSIGFVAIAAADILILMKIHALYRSTGASFEKAQKEFATGVMANKNVQNAATTVITESARATMNGQASNYGGAGGKF